MTAIKGGYTNYGQDIGILMMRTVFPRLVGDIGNARTFSMPVRYQIVDVDPLNMTAKNADARLLTPFIEAARQLEAEGCKAIATSCGFLAKFQRTLADSVHIPVFTSAIMLVPLVRQMINRDREIAIFTERPWNLTEDHFNQAGFSSRDIPVVVSGMPEGSPFPALFIDGGLEEEREVLQQCMEEMTARHMREHPNTGAIVFECTNFGPFSRQVQDIARVPVFGINQLLEYIAACVDVRSYY